MVPVEGLEEGDEATVESEEGGEAAGADTETLVEGSEAAAEVAQHQAKLPDGELGDGERHEVGDLGERYFVAVLLPKERFAENGPMVQHEQRQLSGGVALEAGEHPASRRPEEVDVEGVRPAEDLDQRRVPDNVRHRDRKTDEVPAGGLRLEDGRENLGSDLFLGVIVVRAEDREDRVEEDGIREEGVRERQILAEGENSQGPRTPVQLGDEVFDSTPPPEALPFASSEHPDRLRPPPPRSYRSTL